MVVMLSGKAIDTLGPSDDSTDIINSSRREYQRLSARFTIAIDTTGDLDESSLRGLPNGATL